MIDTSKPSIVEGMPFAEYLADPCDIAVAAIVNRAGVARDGPAGSLDAHQAAEPGCRG